MSSSRKEPRLARRFQKDSKDEAFLEDLNDALVPLQESMYEILPERYPTLHVIGVPRSGSTLLVQTISSALDIGYIDNLIAAFWKAPLCGIALSRKLMSEKRSSSFESTFGRTDGISEPHEFGYFWFSLLGYTEMREPVVPEEHIIDWERVKLLMTNICQAFESPVVFKNFLIGWHMRQISTVLPKTCFVRIKRDPVENALSLLRMREQFLGSKDAWVSMKPREYEWLKDRPYWDQIAGQVYYLDKELDRQIADCGNTNIIECTLEKLREHPNELLERVSQLVEKTGSSAELVRPVSNAFEVRQSTIDVDDSDKQKIEKAVDAIYSNGGFD